MPLVSSLNPVSIYGNGITQTITVSAGYTGEIISSITVSKTPISTGGTGTSFAYQALRLNGNDFKAVDSFSFSYGVGTTSIDFTIFGIYTDYLFSDQSIKYYNNPSNTTIATGLTISVPKNSYNRIVADENATSKVNTYLKISESSETISSPNNLCDYYDEVTAWYELSEKVGAGNSVNAIYSFTPSLKDSVNYYYTFSITYSNTDPFYGSGVSDITIIQQVNYDINAQRIKFDEALNNQTNESTFKC